jgi:hypothetical protein
MCLIATTPGASIPAFERGASVNEQEEKELMELCVDIIAEKDPQKFNELVKALNALMAKKEERLRHSSLSP